jgi:hypothetical protein
MGYYRNSADTNPFDLVTRRLVGLLDSKLPAASTEEQGCNVDGHLSDRKRLYKELEQHQIAAHQAGDVERETFFAKKIKKMDTNFYGALEE